MLFRHRPALAYDVLSIDVGITPGVSEVPGADRHTTAVKPIDKCGEGGGRGGWGRPVRCLQYHQRYRTVNSSTVV